MSTLMAVAIGFGLGVGFLHAVQSCATHFVQRRIRVCSRVN